MQKKYVIVLDFGYTENLSRESSIVDLAYAAEINYQNLSGAMVLAQSCTYEYMYYNQIISSDYLWRIDVGQSSTDGVKGGGSYHVLKRAKEILEEREGDYRKTKIILVAHALHMPRVLRQAKLLGLEAEAGEELPSRFYPTAAQWWCRGKYRWYFREICGYLPLKITGQL